MASAEYDGEEEQSVLMGEDMANVFHKRIVVLDGLRVSSRQLWGVVAELGPLIRLHSLDDHICK